MLSYRNGVQRTEVEMREDKGGGGRRNVRTDEWRCG